MAVRHVVRSVTADQECIFHAVPSRCASQANCFEPWQRAFFQTKAGPQQSRWVWHQAQDVNSQLSWWACCQAHCSWGQVDPTSELPFWMHPALPDTAVLQGALCWYFGRTHESHGFVCRPASWIWARWRGFQTCLRQTQQLNIIRHSLSASRVESGLHPTCLLEMVSVGLRWLYCCNHGQIVMSCWPQGPNICVQTLFRARQESRSNDKINNKNKQNKNIIMKTRKIYPF